MKKLLINARVLDPELKTALILAREFISLELSESNRGRVNDYFLNFNKAENSCAVVRHGNELAINYQTINQALRALGIISGLSGSGRPVRSFSEKQFFSLIGVMLDASRNAVMRIEQLKKYLLNCALMGINSFMLYTETTYEVPGEPLWGYNLGRYSIAELKELSAFAGKIGIEMFPCIQTLGHLRRALQYNAYRDVRDTETVMLVDEPKTYALLEKIIKAASAPYQSKRIHLGLDEAWDLGLGRYLKKKGYQPPFQLMLRHTRRVLGITARLGLKPMMWADMYFRALSKTGDYRDKSIRLTREMKNSVPQDVQLVYWDYHNFGRSHYRHWIKQHRLLNENVLMANGAQTWSRFWANYPLAFKTLADSMSACKKEKIKEAILTLWGDDGNECDFFSALPAVQYFADQAYNKDVDPEKFRNNLSGSCDIDFADWEPAGRLDVPDGFALTPTYLSKTLLWEDPAFGIMQPQLNGVSLNKDYKNIYGKLAACVLRKKTYNFHLELPMLLAKVLSVKADLPTRLYLAYRAQNKKALREIARNDLPCLRREVKRLWLVHRKIWFLNNKPQGWETLEARYGGLLLRMTTLQARLRNYLAGETDRIEELEGERIKLFETNDNRLPAFPYYPAVCAGNLSAVD